MQSLYDGWFAEGSGSLDAAYQVGIELEERDIADLEAIIEETERADMPDGELARPGRGVDLHPDSAAIAFTVGMPPADPSGIGLG